MEERRQIGLRTIAAGAVISVLAACGGNSSPSPTPTATPIPTPRSTPASTVIANPTNRFAPSARSGAAMGYDPVSHRLILFGGTTNTSFSPTISPFRDTWAWDGSRWTQLHPAHQPPGLFGASLVLDPVSHHLDLIAGEGQEASNGFPPQDGMWFWSGSDWSRGVDNPLQQAYANAAANPKTAQIIVTGAGSTGAGAQSPPPFFVGGAYAWDGTTWTQTNALETVPATNAGIGYDPVTQQIVEFGGNQQFSIRNTNTWDGHKWTTVIDGDSLPSTDHSLPPPGEATAATDGATGNLVLLAGSFDDTPTTTSQPTTWVWNRTKWVLQTGTAPALLMLSAMTYDPDVGGVVMFGGQTEVSQNPTLSNAMYIWRGQHWDRVPTS